MQEAHIPGMSLEVDGSKYFLIHHTPADTIDKIDPVEMAKCAAAVAVMAYVVADLPSGWGMTQLGLVLGARGSGLGARGSVDHRGGLASNERRSPFSN